MQEEYQKWITEISNWDTHIKEIKTSEYLSDDQKTQVMGGFNKIREIFGEKWLREVGPERKHPLLHFMINLAPWTRFKLADFGNKLAEAKDVKNFDALKCKLMLATGYHAAEAELAVLILLKRAGFEVEMLDESERRTADILAKIDGKEFYFEVTAMMQAQDWDDAAETFNKLTLALFSDREIEFAGKVYKALSNPRIEELCEKLKTATKKAKTEKKLVEVSEPGAIDFLIAPKGAHDELQKWIQSKNLREGIEGPDVYVDELKRIKRAIRDKIVQIHEDKPGVIVIFDSNLEMSSLVHQAQARQVVYHVEEEVYKHPNLLGVAIISSLRDFRDLEKSSEIIEEKNFFFLSKTSYGSLFYHILVIKNMYSIFGGQMGVLDVFKTFEKMRGEN